MAIGKRFKEKDPRSTRVVEITGSFRDGTGDHYWIAFNVKSRRVTKIRRDVLEKRWEPVK